MSDHRIFEIANKTSPSGEATLSKVSKNPCLYSLNVKHANSHGLIETIRNRIHYTSDNDRDHVDGTLTGKLPFNEDATSSDENNNRTLEAGKAGETRARGIVSVSGHHLNFE